MKPKLVMVFWIDICSAPEWQPKDNVELDPAPCISVGWIVKKDKDTLTIAADQNEGDFGSITTIPMSNVKKIKKLRTDGDYNGK